MAVREGSDKTGKLIILTYYFNLKYGKENKQTEQ